MDWQRSVRMGLLGFAAVILSLSVGCETTPPTDSVVAPEITREACGGDLQSEWCFVVPEDFTPPEWDCLPPAPEGCHYYVLGACYEDAKDEYQQAMYAAHETACEAWCEAVEVRERRQEFCRDTYRACLNDGEDPAHCYDYYRDCFQWSRDGFALDIGLAQQALDEAIEDAESDFLAAVQDCCVLDCPQGNGI